MANRSMINVRANLHAELVKMRDAMREQGKPKASISDALEKCLAEGWSFYQRNAALEGQCNAMARNLVAAFKTFAAHIAAVNAEGVMDGADVAQHWQAIEPMRREQALWAAYHNVTLLTNRPIFHDPQLLIPQLAKDVEPPQYAPEVVQSAFTAAKEVN